MTHQIQIRNRSGKLAVTCSCLIAVVRTGDWQEYRIAGQVTERRTARRRRGVIEARTLFPAADAIAAWRAWHADRGVTV